MSSFEKLNIKQLFPQSLEVELEKNDYIQDGLIFCGDCKQPKQAEIKDVDDEIIKVRVLCECDKKADLEAKKQKKYQEFLDALDVFEKVLQGKVDPEHTFENNDFENKMATDFSLRYVENWENMFKNNMGIVFYGGVGTGKTFFADCIANRLREQMKYATSVSVANLIDLLHSSNDTSKIMYAINFFDLIIFDDLGSERNTSYGLEKIYSVFDARYRSGKPLIVTTNLDIVDIGSELKSVETPFKRILDRVSEMCPLEIKIDGKSKRQNIAKERRNLAREMLYGKK